jgi:hypothetical protein
MNSLAWYCFRLVLQFKTRLRPTRQRPKTWETDMRRGSAGPARHRHPVVDVQDHNTPSLSFTYKSDQPVEASSFPQLFPLPRGKPALHLPPASHRSTALFRDAFHVANPWVLAVVLPLVSPSSAVSSAIPVGPLEDAHHRRWAPPCRSSHCWPSVQNGSSCLALSRAEGLYPRPLRPLHAILLCLVAEFPLPDHSLGEDPLPSHLKWVMV